MSAYYPQGSGMSSKRLIVLGIIIAFHAVIIYAFATGLVQNGKRLVQTILQTSIIETQKTQELPPPPPNVDLKAPPPVSVVAPEVTINIPVAPPHITPPPPPPPAPKPIVRAPPAPIQLPRPTYVPDTNDYYPDAARRNNEEGRVMVNVCVDTRGRVTNTKVTASSGHPMLDDAALKVAKAFRFKPATQSGKAVVDCVG